MRYKIKSKSDKLERPVYRGEIITTWPELVNIVIDALNAKKMTSTFWAEIHKEAKGKWERVYPLDI